MSDDFEFKYVGVCVSGTESVDINLIWGHKYCIYRRAHDSDYYIGVSELGSEEVYDGWLESRFVKCNLTINEFKEVVI